MAVGANRPQVAVVIPARNAAGTLARCLSALADEGIPGATSELIVVDDGSHDDTARMAALAGAQVLKIDGRGPAAARNLGARAAQAEYLVFLDADTAPRRGWLEALLQPFADPAIVAVKGRYVTQQRGIVARFSQLEFEEKYARLERAPRVDFVDTGTAAYRRGVFMRAGGFDESFPAQSAEDVELAFRLAAGGARFAFSPAACVLHSHAESLFEYLTKKARYGFFRVTVYRRHPSKLKGDSYTPPWMGAQIVLSAVVPVTVVAWLAGLPGWLALVSVLGFGALCWPLLHRAAVRDRGLTPWVVPLSYLRAFAQGLGLLRGILAVLLGRGLPEPKAVEAQR